MSHFYRFIKKLSILKFISEIFLIEWRKNVFDVELCNLFVCKRRCWASTRRIRVVTRWWSRDFSVVSLEGFEIIHWNVLLLSNSFRYHLDESSGRIFLFILFLPFFLFLSSICFGVSLRNLLVERLCLRYTYKPFGSVSSIQWPTESKKLWEKE